MITKIFAPIFCFEKSLGVHALRSFLLFFYFYFICFKSIILSQNKKLGKWTIKHWSEWTFYGCNIVSDYRVMKERYSTRIVIYGVDLDNRINELNDALHDVLVQVFDIAFYIFHFMAFNFLFRATYIFLVFFIVT